MKTISAQGLQLIKDFEGCRLTAYDDLQPNKVLTPDTEIKGTLTIGYGHTVNVSIGQTITQEQADSLLLSDLERYIKSVNDSYYVPFISELNQNQFDALVSFCYNCGARNLRELCETDISEIPNTITLYNKSKGVILGGLVRRREAEKQLFIKEEQQMEQNNIDYLAKINELEEVMKKIIIGLTQVADKLADIPAPDWFIEEFPNALDLLNQKTGTADFWRAFTIALRIMKVSNKQ